MREVDRALVSADGRCRVATTSQEIAVEPMDFRLGPSLAGTRGDPQSFAESLLAKIRIRCATIPLLTKPGTLPARA
ncbi:MAG: hypothetical protein JO134_22915 [Xanthobacteraceae bacterium]|nr:hypothetical protein [Xanthobacteraceae bacterium]